MLAITDSPVLLGDLLEGCLTRISSRSAAPRNAS
jgi:hypothetical protein